MKTAASFVETKIAMQVGSFYDKFCVLMTGFKQTSLYNFADYTYCYCMRFK